MVVKPELVADGGVVNLAEPNSLLIVSPALADANNGNWQTAKRWSDLLSAHYSSRIIKNWPDWGVDSGAVAQSYSQDSVKASVQAPTQEPEGIMLALHARRSADSIHAWAANKGYQADCPGLVVALTGTDLYRDIHTHAEAMESLRLAKSLIVLQSKAIEAVPLEFRHKAHVVYQSTEALPAILDKGPVLKVLMVGHLREEKMPETYMQAAQILKDEKGIVLEHVGEALDEKYLEMSRRTTAQCPNYHWLGGLSYPRSRKKIQEAHILVHCSKMEGGAHVIMEAVRSGTPVLASRIDGNVGMLGEDYAGYFELGNAQQLADMIKQLKGDLNSEQQSRLPNTPQGNNLNHNLIVQSKRRAPLFAAEQERASLLSILGLCRKQPQPE